MTNPSPHVPASQAFDESEQEIWAQIDHELVRLKKKPVAGQLEQKYQGQKSQALLEGRTRATEWTVPLKISGVYIQQTKEWAESLYQVYCEVWELQGKVRTPAFVRAVFQNGLLPAIEAGIAEVKKALGHSALRKHSDDLTSLQIEDIEHEASEIRESWRTRVEIEARELQLRQANKAAVAEQERKESKPAPQVTKAPPPVSAT